MGFPNVHDFWGHNQLGPAGFPFEGRRVADTPTPMIFNDVVTWPEVDVQGTHGGYTVFAFRSATETNVNNAYAYAHTDDTTFNVLTDFNPPLPTETFFFRVQAMGTDLAPNADFLIWNAHLPSELSERAISPPYEDPDPDPAPPAVHPAPPSGGRPSPPVTAPPRDPAAVAPTPPSQQANMPVGSAVMGTDQTAEIIFHALTAGDPVVISLPNNTRYADFQSSDIAALAYRGDDLSVERAGVRIIVPGDVLAEISPANLQTFRIEIGSVSDALVDAVGDVDQGDLLSVFYVNIIVNGSGVGDLNAPVVISLDAAQFGVTAATYGVTGARVNAGGSFSLLGGSLSQGRFEFITDSLSSYALLSGVTFTSLAFTVDTASFALNGASQGLDVAPTIINGRTMVPVRAIAEGLGANVVWNEAASAISIDLGETSVELAIGVLAPGMDVPATIVDGRALVPLRFISEQLGASVVWNSRDQGIGIYR